MTDEELLDELDPDFRAAVDSAFDFAAYLRSRTSVPWDLGDSNWIFDLEKAEDIVAGRHHEQNIPYAFPDGQVQWLYNPTREREDLAVNNEWQWQLCRMGYWPNLGHAWRATGNDCYAEAFVRHLRSFAAQCPRPADHGNYPVSAWRTIESGIRMRGSWPDAFHLFLPSPVFTDGDILLYLKLCIEHARHLRAWHRPAGNWLAMEMAGLYTVGAVFPELKLAAPWRQYAVDRAYEELDRQFTPDGAQVELSANYHWVALRNLIHIPKIARTVGRMDEIPDDFIARSQKAFDYTLLNLTPDGSTPRVNDSLNSQDVASIMAVAHKLFPNRDDYLWVATNGKEGSPPTVRSHGFPYAGYLLMRSGWQIDANLLCFDAGPPGLAHIHQDKLNVMLWAFGREILIDNGGGPYEQSKWRRYGVDTFSHNTVLVDGLPQRRQRGFADAPLSDIHWVSTPAGDYACGIYDEIYGESQPASHTRRILFVQPDVFLVVDVLTSKDGQAHFYQGRWHFKCAEVDRLGAPGSVSTATPEEPNLAVVPLFCDGLDVAIVSAQEEPEVLGWWIRNLVDPVAIPAATVLHTRSGSDPQCFATLLLPIRPGQRNPVQRVEQRGFLSVAAHLTDGRHFDISCSTEGLSFKEILPDGALGRMLSFP